MSFLLQAGSIGDAAMCVVMLCAWRCSVTRRNTQYDQRWPLLALMFAGLTLEKAFAIDGQIQDTLRWIAQKNKLYDIRRVGQSLALILVIVLATLTLRKVSRRPPLQSSINSIHVLALLLLIYDVIRAVSLHQVDAILFASIGPLHLNHVIEGGLTSLILWFTWSHLRTPMSAPRQERKSIRRRP